MALQKNYMTNYGVIGDYWKISEFNFNSYTGKTNVIVELFLNQDARNESKGCLADLSFSFTGEKIRSEIYQDLKNLEIFSGANDI